MGDTIEDYFGGGENFGVDIQYDNGGLDLDTAERLVSAESKLQDEFYLMYGDNYVEIDIREAYLKMKQTNTKLCMTIQPKSPGNIIVRGSWGEYKQQRDKDLKWVEVGYMYVKNHLSKV